MINIMNLLYKIVIFFPFCFLSEIGKAQTNIQSSFGTR